MRALRVVGAAGGASGHGEVRLRHHRLVGRRILERPVRHRQAGAARSWRSGSPPRVRRAARAARSIDSSLLPASTELPWLTRCVRRRQIVSISGLSRSASRPAWPVDGAFVMTHLRLQAAGRLERSAAMGRRRWQCAAASRQAPGNGAGSAGHAHCWRSSRCRTASKPPGRKSTVRKRSLCSRREAIRMNTRNAVSLNPKPSGGGSASGRPWYRPCRYRDEIAMRGVRFRVDVRSSQRVVRGL